MWLLWGTVLGVVAVAVGAVLAVLLFGGGTSTTTNEELAASDSSHTSHDESFRSFRNLTTYPDSVVWDSYRYALANPQILSYIPCFCGCVHHGDASNFNCYVDEVKGDGSVRYDPHAAG